MRTFLGRRLSARLCALMTVILLLASPATRSLGKEFAAVGTVDCGLPSGRHCTIDGLLTIWTSSVSGERERVVIDVSWVLGQLPELDQDDEITLELQSTATGLRAISVVDPEGNPLRAKREKERDQQEDSSNANAGGCGNGRTFLIGDTPAGSRSVVAACAHGFVIGQQIVLFQPDLQPQTLTVTDLIPLTGDGTRARFCPGENPGDVQRVRVVGGGATVVCFAEATTGLLRGATSEAILGAQKLHGNPTALPYAVMITLILVIQITLLSQLICIEEQGVCYQYGGIVATITPSPTRTPTVPPGATLTFTPTVTVTPSVTVTPTVTVTAGPAPSCIGFGVTCQAPGLLPSAPTQNIQQGDCAGADDCVTFTGLAGTAGVSVTARLTNVVLSTATINVEAVNADGSPAANVNLICINTSLPVVVCNTGITSRYPKLGGVVTVTR